MKQLILFFVLAIVCLAKPRKDHDLYELEELAGDDQEMLQLLQLFVNDEMRRQELAKKKREEEPSKRKTRKMQRKPRKVIAVSVNDEMRRQETPKKKREEEPPKMKTRKMQRKPRKVFAVPAGEDGENDNDGWDHVLAQLIKNEEERYKEPKIKSIEEGKKFMKKHCRKGGKCKLPKPKVIKIRRVRVNSAPRVMTGSEKESVRRQRRVMRRVFSRIVNADEGNMPIHPWKKEKKMRLQRMVRRDFSTMVNADEGNIPMHPWKKEKKMKTLRNKKKHQSTKNFVLNASHLMEEELPQFYEEKNGDFPPEEGDIPPTHPSKPKKCPIKKYFDKTKKSMGKLRRRLSKEPAGIKITLALAISAIITMQIWIISQIIALITGKEEYDDDEDDEEKGKRRRKNGKYQAVPSGEECNCSSCDKCNTRKPHPAEIAANIELKQ